MLKKLLFLLIASFYALLPLVSVKPAHAQGAEIYKPITPFQLQQDIAEFRAAGAKGYLVWQYSGDRGLGTEFENDQFSWFRNIGSGPEICATLKEAADTGGMFIGVNIASAGDPRFQGQLGDHFSYLKNSCGVSVIRVFAYKGGPAGMTAVLDAAEAAGVQIIVSIGDYSNGGGFVPQGAGKSWYESGYRTSFKQYVADVVNAIRNRPGLYGVELANEAHCGGDATAINAYIAWASDLTTLVRGSGINRVGIGQMASTEASRCDSPGVGDFARTNSPSATGVTMASGHYYNAEEKASNLDALRKTPNGVDFYVGEASYGKTQDRPEDYYLYPIKGLPTDTNPGDQNQILTDLIDQGYQMQCSTPKITIEALEGGEIARLKELAQQNGSYVINRPGALSEQTFDYTQSKIPLLRDSNPISNLYNSLEDFWGFQSLKSPSSDIQTPISSASLYTLLSLEEQCIRKVKILETIEDMCSRLADPSTCALYQKVADTDFTTRSLLDAYRSQSDTLSCQNIYNDNTTRTSQLTDQQKQIVSALDKVPLYLDRAYRLAFLVIVTELKADQPTSFFNFLRSNSTSQPRDEVDVIAFKIPDFGTNKPLTEKAYKDPLQITRDALLVPQQIAANTQATTQRREALRTAQPTTPNINCSSETCTDPTVRALVDLINRSPAQSCEANPQDLQYEPVNEIGSSGTLVSNPGTEFADGTDPAEKVTSTGNAQQAVFRFLSNIRLGLNGEKETKIKGYLVAPVGDEAQSIEMALLSMFDVEWVNQYLNDPSVKRYYKITGIDQKLEGAQLKERFNDPQVDLSTCRFIDGRITCNQREATLDISADESDHEPRLPFGGIGFLTRTIQLALSQIGTKAHEYLSSCETTEQFLLGTCGGKYTRTSEINVGGSPYMNQEVISTADCKSFARIGAGPQAITDPARLGPACTANQTTSSQVGLPAILYNQNLDIPAWRNPNDAVPTCDLQLYKYIVCTNGPGPTADGLARQGNAPALIAHRVDANGTFNPNGAMTACEYVVQQAKQRGISPKLALAMWGEESGFSAFTSASGGEDFGVKLSSSSTSRASGSLKAQVDGFLNTINNSSYTNYLSFLLAYSGEVDKTQQAPVKFCRNRYFPDRLKTFYNYFNL